MHDLFSLALTLLLTRAICVVLKLGWEDTIDKVVNRDRLNMKRCAKYLQANIDEVYCFQTISILIE